MKRAIPLFILLFSAFGLLAQSKNEVTLQYIETYTPMALEQETLHKIPACITLAQGILESASGQSDLARRANNHFGIKCHSNWTGNTYHKNDDKENECFRAYASPAQSFEDHSLFLKRNRYSALFSLDIADYKGWAKGLKEAGYATNPQYPELLINLIELYGLDTLSQAPQQYAILPTDTVKVENTVENLQKSRHQNPNIYEVSPRHHDRQRKPRRRRSDMISLSEYLSRRAKQRAHEEGKTDDSGRLSLFEKLNKNKQNTRTQTPSPASEQ